MRRMGDVGRPAPADLTDEPAVLAGAAREHLREKFLRAKVAVSGANFAVADTGTLVVVESEGNGRMCLTLPEVLISVVGIEKVVATWSDLDPMLRLLPRSSTGERMNPYTSTWSGVTPGDGPQEVHVVLLDNGRTRALADDVGRQALRCIRCSACLNVCPVYERVGGHAYGSVYPGPIGAILNPLLNGVSDEQTASLPYASSLCGACFEVCPVRIDIPSVLVDQRAAVVDSHRGDRVPKAEAVAMKAAAWAFSDSRRLAWAERASGIAGRVITRFSRTTLPGGRAASGRLPGPAAGWTGARDLPAPPAESFREWWDRTDGGQEDGTVSARDDILAAVRAALADVSPAVDVPAAPRAPDRGDLVALFVERVEDYRAVVTRCAAADLAAVVAERARRRRTPSYLPGSTSRSRAPSSTTASPPPSSTRIDAVVTRARVGHRRDRHDRPGPPARPGPARDQPRPRPPRLHRRREPGRRRRARRDRAARPGRVRSPGSAARPPPATSSSTGSRASTARGPCTSSSSAPDPLGRAHPRAWTAQPPAGSSVLLRGRPDQYLVDAETDTPGFSPG